MPKRVFHRASIGFFAISERSSICLCLSLHMIKWGRWVVRQKIRRLLLISADQGSDEDFDTLLPWHVDAVWSQTARSGGEWLFCQISSPEGSARLLPVPHHSEFVGHPRLLLSARGSRLVWEFPDHVRHRSPKASPPRRCANPAQQGPETPPIQSEWHRVAGGALHATASVVTRPFCKTLPHNDQSSTPPAAQ